MSEAQDLDGFQPDEEPRKLRRATLKEELLALTGDAKDAIILNELIRCQARCRHRDAYIAEEKRILQLKGQKIELSGDRGWFYKSAKELSHETMLNLSESNMRARLQKLVARGYLYERQNPDPWRKTREYRVPLVHIDAELQKLGYRLDGWLIRQVIPDAPDPEPDSDEDRPAEVRTSETEVRYSETEVGTSVSDVPTSETNVRGSETEGRTLDNRSSYRPSTKQTSTPKTRNFKQATPSSPAGSDAVGNHDLNSNGDGSTPSNGRLDSTQEPGAGVAADPESLMLEMMEWGLSSKDAQRLAATVPHLCRKQLDWLPDRGVRSNYGAILLRSITEGWGAPKTVVNRRIHEQEAAAAEQARLHREEQERERQAEQDAVRARQAAELEELTARFDALGEQCAVYLDLARSRFQIYAGRDDNDDFLRRAAIELYRADLLKSGQENEVPEDVVSAPAAVTQPDEDEDPDDELPEAALRARRIGEIRNSADAAETFYLSLDPRTQERIIEQSRAKLPGIDEGSKAFASVRHNVLRAMIAAGELKVHIEERRKVA